MPLIQVAAFLITSAVTLAVIYYKLPINYIQDVIILLLLFLLIGSKKVLGSSAKIKSPYRVIFLSLIALLIQLLVLSTGAIFSPFLILIHLFALATGFLFDLITPAIFLVTTIAVMVIGTRLNTQLSALFANDPWSAILYVISFIVIIPVAYLVTKTYHVKEALSRILTERLAIGQKREEQILRGLDEIVMVTDKNLQVLSASEAVHKLLKKSDDQILGKELFTVIQLIDKSGLPANQQTLMLNQVLENKVTHIIKDSKLVLGENRTIPITLQISPITDQNGEVSQITFVLSSASQGSLSPHADLNLAKSRNKKLWENLKSTLVQSSQTQLAAQVILLTNYQNAILAYQELEDHQLVLNPSLVSVAYLVRKVIIEEKPLADYFSVKLKFRIPETDHDAENSYFNLIETNAPSSALPITNFTTVTDINLLKTVIQNLVDLSIFLSSGQEAEVGATLNHQADHIKVEMLSKTEQLTDSELNDLFEQYYKNIISIGNLKYSNGLEGSLAKRMAGPLEVNLDVKFDHIFQAVVFTLMIPKRSSASL